MIELVQEDIKPVTVIVFCMFKKLEEKLDTKSRNVKNVEKNPKIKPTKNQIKILKV